MTHLQKIIEVGVALRDLARHYGYKNLHEYYKDADEIARELPLDFTHDTGEYIVSIEERAKIAKSTVIVVKKLKFTPKQTGGKKHG